MAVKTTTQTYQDGSEIVLDSSGRVRGITFSDALDYLFDENKSLRQMAMDLQQQQLVATAIATLNPVVVDPPAPSPAVIVTP